MHIAAALKVVRDAARVSDTDVADERENPRKHRNGRPHNGAVGSALDKRFFVAHYFYMVCQLISPFTVWVLWGNHMGNINFGLWLF